MLTWSKEERAEASLLEAIHEGGLVTKLVGARVLVDSGGLGKGPGDGWLVSRGSDLTPGELLEGARGDLERLPGRRAAAAPRSRRTRGHRGGAGRGGSERGHAHGATHAAQAVHSARSPGHPRPRHRAGPGLVIGCAFKTAGRSFTIQSRIECTFESAAYGPHN